MIELPEGFDSIFRYIVVVSQRAEQLIGGARPRTDSRFKKKTLEARDDVDAGLVEWRVLSQEELDAQRQAIVEQFRAEVAGEDLMPEASPSVPDVLPTSTQSARPAPAEVDDGDRDNELARLQRLLGMTKEAGDDNVGMIEAAPEKADDVDLELDDLNDDVIDVEDKDED
jgi:DNA-directed RNA polymerase subunit K/omega